MADTVELVVKLLGDGAQLAVAFDELQKKVLSVANTVAKVAKESATAEKAASDEVVAVIKKAAQDEADAKLAGLAKELNAEEKAKQSALDAAKAVAQGAQNADEAMTKAYQHAYKSLEQAATDADRKVETAARELAAAEKQLSDAQVTAAKAVGTAEEAAANKAVAAAQSEVTRKKSALDKSAADAVAAANKVEKAREDAALKAERVEEQSAQRAAAEYKKQWQDVQNVAQKVAMAAGAMGAAITGPLAIAAKGAVDFESRWAEVLTMMSSNTPQKTIAEMKSGIQDLAMRYGIDAKDAVEALYQTLSSGIKPENSIAFLKQAAIGATAGVSSLTDAVNIGSRVINAYGDAAGGMGHVMDLAMKSVQTGQLRFRDLADQIPRVAATAADAGVKVDELFGMFAKLGQAGVPMEAASAGMNALFMNVAKVQDQAAAEAKKLGVEWSSTALQAQGLEKFINGIDDAITRASKNGLKVATDADIAKETAKLDTISKKVQEVTVELQKAGGVRTIVNEGAITTASNHLQELILKQRQLTAELVQGPKNPSGVRNELQKVQLEIQQTTQKLGTLQQGSTKVLDPDGSKTSGLQTKLKALQDELQKGTLKLQQMKTGVDTVTRQQEWANLVGSIEAARDVMGATSNKTQSFKDVMDSMRNSMGAAADAEKKMEDNSPQFAINQMTETTKAAARQIGEALLPAIRDFVAWVQKIAVAYREWALAHPGLNKALAYTAAVVGGLLVVFAAIAAAVAIVAGVFAALTSTVGVWVIAIIAAVAVVAKAIWDFISNFDQVKSDWNALWSYLSTVVSETGTAIAYYWNQLIDGIKTGFSTLGGWISSAFSSVFPDIQASLSQFFAWLSSGWDLAKSYVTGWTDALKSAIGGAVDWAIGKLQGMWNFIKNIPTAIKNAVTGGGGGDTNTPAVPPATVPGFAGGGVVTRRTLAYVGEAGPEAMIPLASGSVPVHFIGSPETVNVPTNAPNDKSQGGPVHVHIYPQKGQSPQQIFDTFMHELSRRKGLI